MPSANKREVRFVRALLPDHEARCGGDGLFRAAGEGRITTLSGGEVGALVSAGALAGDTTVCRPSRESISWLRRQLSEVEPQAAQHRQEIRTADGRRLNLAESPLARTCRTLPPPGRPSRFWRRTRSRRANGCGGWRNGPGCVRASPCPTTPRTRQAAEAAARRKSAIRRRTPDAPLRILFEPCRPIALTWCSMSAAWRRGCRRLKVSAAGRAAAPSWCCASGWTNSRGISAWRRWRWAKRRAGTAPGWMVRGRRCSAMADRRQASARASARMRLTIATNPLERCVLRCSRRPRRSKTAMASTAAISSTGRPE